MFNLTPKGDQTTLEDQIDSVLSQMNDKTAADPEFAVMVDQLEKLYRMKTSNRGRFGSADTLITVAANLAGIVLVLRFERVDIVTSKALGMVLKAKA